MSDMPTADDLLASSQAAAAYKAALPDGKFIAFATTPLDRIGIPAWSARFDDGNHADGGLGYGLTDADAFTGAMGELSEGFYGAAALARAPRQIGSYDEMVVRNGREHVLAPVSICLPAGSLTTDDTPVQWIEARAWPTNRSVWIPIEIVADSNKKLPAGYEPMITPITNGRGAHSTLEDALAHAVEELIQRDGNGLNYRALDQGVVIDATPEELGVDINEIMLVLDKYGVDVKLKWASSEFGMANVFVVGTDRVLGETHEIASTAAGEAAETNAQLAIRKALLEFAAARARKLMTHGPLEAIAQIAPLDYQPLLRSADPSEEEPRTIEAMASWMTAEPGALVAMLQNSVLAERSHIPFSSLPSQTFTSTTKKLDFLAEQLAAADIEILYVDCSPPGADDVHVVKAIAPGLEVETLSYYRIGERNARKLLHAGSPLVGQGPMPDGAKPVRLTRAATERLGGPTWLNVKAVDEAVGELYPLYREPSRHAVQAYLKQRP